ncbi:hypothetical protein HPB52_014461 [Rhipicephalus sanguineus]|uniref:RING-type domain-containing protein n=1 Tax=Rhipicephalus sanguineus TaxID=34632 RepID=A0A9D4Q061_RHISA|nr:hypothetical protein HPB52_014461 [Rhipicephalus sanguineus]
MCPTCGICIESLRRRDSPVATLCGHVFHEHCLEQWCESKGNTDAPCPQCRLPISKGDLRRLFLDDHRPRRKRHHRRGDIANDHMEDATFAAVPEDFSTEEASGTTSASPSVNETWVFPPEPATFLDRLLMIVADVNSMGREAAQKIRLSMHFVD